MANVDWVPAEIALQKLFAEIVAANPAVKPTFVLPYIQQLQNQLPSIKNPTNADAVKAVIQLLKLI